MGHNTKVSLHGKNYYNECGYTCESLTLIATFDSKDLAETYVLNSIEMILGKTSEGCDSYKFKEDSLLAGYENFEVGVYQIPHNPK